MPSKKTRLRMAVILAALREGATFAAACTAAGVCTKSLSNWCDADPELDLRVREARLTALTAQRDRMVAELEKATA